MNKACSFKFLQYKDIVASRCFVVVMPFGCAKSFRSEGTLSSVGRSPPRHIRPHSTADRLPGYACNTVSSQLRVSRCDVKRSHVGCICPRFSKFCVKACKHFYGNNGSSCHNVCYLWFILCVISVVLCLCTTACLLSIFQFLLMQCFSVTSFLLRRITEAKPKTIINWIAIG